MDSLGARIRFARKQKGLTQDNLAELVGAARPSISYWETGKITPDTESLTRLASALEVPFSFLVGEKGLKLLHQKEAEHTETLSPHKVDTGMSIKNIIPSDNLIWVPVISSEVRPSAGNGNNYAYSDIEWEEVDKTPLFDGELAALYSPDSLLSMYVDGDSMEPQIYHGDLVVFNHCNNWVSGNIMVVCLDGRLMVKGVISMGEGKLPVLRSINKDYNDIQINEDSFFIVYGRVLRIIRVSKPKPVI